MLYKNNIGLLKAAYSHFFKRNLFTTKLQCSGTANKICNNIVFINDGEDENELNIRFNWTTRSKQILFVRPADETVDQSLKIMTRKIQRKDPEFTKQIHELKLIGENNNLSDIVHTWQELIPKLSELHLHLDGIKYQIVYNYPLIYEIRIPERTSVGFDVFPNCINYTGDFSNLKFKWLRKYRTDKKFVELDNPKKCIYHCEHDDLGGKLQLICEVHFNGILTSFTRSNIAVIDKIDTSAIDSRHMHTPKHLPDDQFRIVSYNLLADFYAHTETSKKDIFNYCDPKWLDFDYRSKLQLKELRGYHSDLYCLQEMDEKLFENNFQFIFGSLGFDGIFRKKSGTDEGLAVFYNTTKFSLVADHSFVFHEAFQSSSYLMELCDILNANHELKEKVLNLFNIALILHLASTEDNNKQLLLVNTHLYSQPNCHSVRVVQLACILRHIEHLVHELNLKQKETELSIVLCGDLNSLPEGPLNSLMLNGNIPNENEMFADDIYKLSTNFNVSHSLKFGSACKSVPFTSYSMTSQWNTLDYIYHTKNLKVLQTVPMPENEHLINKVPSDQFPSDHLALIADFQWGNASNS